MRRFAATLCCLLALSACESLPSWMGGAVQEIKRAPGERIDVVLNQSRIAPDAAAKDLPIEIPAQMDLPEWHNHNTAMLTPHIGLTGITQQQVARIGEGNDFSRWAAAPISASGMVFAMDAAGVVSAHKVEDISDIAWVNADGLTKHVPDVLGGGLVFDTGVIYVTTGQGGLRAIDAANGTTKWTISVGAPMRGAPAVADGLVVVLTADNQTLAFDASNGSPRWSHRGIRENAGFFSTTAPVISDGIVVAAYSSGELFALRAETGNVLWNDTLGSSNKTNAAAVFNGIDADPIVQDGVVVVASASGEIQASALLNGRPLWQQKIGAHNTPWSAGNVLFVLSDTHDVAALFKRDGSVRWAESLAQHDERDANKDITPQLYGPILAGNAVLVLDREGNLITFKPQDGKRLGSYALTDDIVSAPIITGGALYVITKDAKLHRYY